MLDSLKSNKINLLLILVIGLFYWVFAFNLVRSDFIKLISLYGALFLLSYKIYQPNKGRFWFLTGIGILFRLIFIGVLPNLSQDFYRFIWDGRWVYQGINPYLFTPESFLNSLSTALEVTKEASIHQVQELYAGMGSLNGSHFSNYPPINQLCFTIAALFSGNSILGSVIVFRLLILFADIGILFFGRKLLISLGKDPNHIFWYFLNPFIIIELTGNLHFEAVMLFFMIASLYYLHKRKWIWGAVLLGISVSVKLIPLLFLPLFYQWFMNKKNNLGFLKLLMFYLITIGTVLITFLPFYSSAFVSNFSETIGLWFQNFEFNASIYYIIRWIGFQTVGWNIIETVGKILPLLVIAFITLITFIRNNKNFDQLITVMLFAISFYFLFSTTVHPWYIATPLLLSIFTNYRFPIVWSFAIIFSYTAYGINGFSENLWLVSLEYVIVIGFFICEIKTRKNRIIK